MFFSSNSCLILVIKVFIKRKIFSVAIILSAYTRACTHISTCAQKHTDCTKCNSKRAANTTRWIKTAAWNGKRTWRKCDWVNRIDLDGNDQRDLNTEENGHIHSLSTYMEALWAHCSFQHKIVTLAKCVIIPSIAGIFYFVCRLHDMTKDLTW